MERYLIFTLMAAMTILSPGPGVLKSLTNALNYGLRPALIGIVGLSCGIFCVAALSASGLGILLTSSAKAFVAIRLGGAAYLSYLGIKLWRAPALEFKPSQALSVRRRTLFFEGWMLQFSNPGALIFFLSILPQFIRPSRAFLPQFLLLVLTFCSLLVLIHSGYAIFAERARRWMGASHGGRWFNRIGGACFFLFGALLLRAGLKG